MIPITEGTRIICRSKDSSIATRIASNHGGSRLNQFLYTIYSDTLDGNGIRYLYRLTEDCTKWYLIMIVVTSSDEKLG
jgi:hypothetical protein